MMPFSGGFFAGGMESTENGLVIVSFAAAFLYLMMIARAPSMRRTLIKAAAIGLLAALAVATRAPDLLVAALAFSAVGDAALAQEDERGFLVGLGAFLLAHIAYSALFLGLGGEGFGVAMFAAHWPVMVPIVLFAGVFGTLLVRKAGRLAVPVAVYVVAIAAMGVSAATVGGAVLAGAALFIASDALLGTEKFLLGAASPLRRITQPLVWALYWLGQCTITIAVIKLLQLA
jgi:uncharacterized membrane protein YhhN